MLFVEIVPETSKVGMKNATNAGKTIAGKPVPISKSHFPAGTDLRAHWRASGKGMARRVTGKKGFQSFQMLRQQWKYFRGKTKRKTLLRRLLLVLREVVIGIGVECKVSKRDVEVAKNCCLFCVDIQESGLVCQKSLSLLSLGNLLQRFEVFLSRQD